MYDFENMTAPSVEDNIIILWADEPPVWTMNLVLSVL